MGKSNNSLGAIPLPIFLAMVCSFLVVMGMCGLGTSMVDKQHRAQEAQTMASQTELVATLSTGGSFVTVCQNGIYFLYVLAQDQFQAQILAGYTDKVIMKYVVDTSSRQNLFGCVKIVVVDDPNGLHEFKIFKEP